MIKFTSAIFLALALITASPAMADELIQSYVAHLSARDHAASDGVKLTTVAEIIRQDRANFHKFDKRDEDDESDLLFNSADARELIEGLVKRGNIDEDVERAILRGNPRVVVSLYQSSKNGKEYIGVVLYHK